ncbi:MULTISPECIES: DUF2164 domain-containing protein [Clostridium]|uniref:DUF2164 domain-containing protein n=1 Tax=Clostridium TaxID=1485 RepID=UPI000825342B|nr:MULTISPECIES: DUF2164 domain-containing protein [Clostridium]PJI07161.1 DUF2164 domain-containing protein [Clostridium sp. CT7]
MMDSSKIDLNKDKRKDMIELIKDYFLNERDEELGDLASSLILDFIIEKLAPEFYNQGVYDSYKYMNEKIDDLLEIQKRV